ncbi:MAG TPA: Gfo/Idh/MocA family oxidoreductase [Mycobacteriales bacterium]|nr:Gfo/Idh/MocA family oxidoreductase [Mycobacteriales bacterium]
MTPRLGFLGVGWIGRNRMEAIARCGAVDVVAVADSDASTAAAAAAAAGGHVVDADELLHGELGLDGIVIATPSALHAQQTISALERGLAVFCQKPLGRTAAECEAVVDTARGADRLLAVDLSYRHLSAIEPIRATLAAGAIGEVYAADLTFHNAYGPDKPWFTDPAQSGGGCVIDLGIHLIDLALWLLDRPKVDAVTARLFAHGRPLDPAPIVVEDYATARLDLATGATVTLTCSWFLHAGRDAVIGATLHGTRGSLALHNVDGSFYDFSAWQHTGTTSRRLSEPPDDWGGRAAVTWARRLAAGERFDPANAELVEVAQVIDRIYGR